MAPFGVQGPEKSKEMDMIGMCVVRVVRNTENAAKPLSPTRSF